MLEKESRGRALAGEANLRLRALRSRESQLHTELAAATAALRIVRATPTTLAAPDAPATPAPALRS